MRKPLYIGLLLGALLSAVGCQRAVTIEFPKDGTYEDPVKTFTVKFHPEFKPGTLSLIHI